MLKNIKLVIILIAILLAVAVAALIFGPNIQAKGTTKSTGSYELQITEICSKNESIIPDNSGKYRDYIELYNAGAPLDLKGFSLSDGKNHSAAFESLYLGTGEYRVVFLDDDLTGFSLSASGGETLRLLDPQGGIVIELTTSAVLEDQVMLLSGSVYHSSYDASPGFANTTEGLEAFKTGTKADNPKLQITEVLLGNSSTLPDEKGVYSDVVELTNASDQTLHLGGYSLSDDENQRFAYRLPELALEPGGRVVIYCDGKNYVSGSFIHANFGLAHGETLSLTDSSGATCSMTCQFLADDISQLLAEGSYESGLPSPGFENSDSGLSAFLNSRINSDSALIISEVLVSGTGVPYNGVLCDAVEIFNTTDQPVSTAGWYLSDGGAPYSYPLPVQELAAGACTVIICSGQTTGFGLAAGETVYLTGPDYRYAQPVTCAVSDEGHSITYTPDGFTTAAVSLGYHNTGSDRSNYLAQSSGKDLMITEAMSANTAYLKGAYKTTCDWIELYNPTDSPIELSGYCITDTEDNLSQFTLPAKTLQPGSYCVIFMSESGLNLDKTYGRVPMNLSSSGERLYITKGGQIVEHMILPALASDVSYGLADGEFVQLAKATPGSSNSGAAQSSAAPTAITPQGSYDDIEYLDVELSAAGKIYYTTNAYAPTAASIPYEGPIRLTQTTVLRVISIEEGKAPSPVLDLTYLINENDNLSVVTIVSDPNGLFSMASGIYVSGPNPGDYPNHTSNYWQDWERAATVSLFETDGSVGFSESCGMKIFGGYSRVLSKKSLSFFFRDKYGASSLDYALFGDEGLDSFEAFILRSGGQDTFAGRMRDEVITSIASEYLGIPVQDYRPVVVYINGQYYGLHYIREKVNEQYVSGHYGVDPDTVNIAEWTGVRNDQYNELQKYVRFHNMNDPECYDYVMSQIDEANYVDYLIAEMWIGNTDNGNTKFFTTPEIPWTWVMFDVDFAFFAPAGNDVAINLNADELGVLDDNSKTIAVRMFANQEFKDYFLTRFAYQINEVWTEEIILARIAEIEAMIAPDMEKDCARWGQDIDVWYSNLETMRYFVQNRNKYIIPDIQAYFGLTDAEMAAYGFPEV